MNTRWFVGWLVASGVTLVGQAPAAAQLVPAPGEMRGSVAPLVDRVKDSVVTIQSTKFIQRVMREDPYLQFLRERMGMRQPQAQRETQQSLGSGFIIDTQGTILTNNHVVAGADDVQVQLSDDRVLPAQILGTDPRTDVAVLRLKNPPRDLKPVSLGDSDKVRVGDYVLAIGNPLGLGQTVTMGIVSAKNRGLGGKLIDIADFIQTDAAINQGNSGGPLFNFNGQVVGINSAILNPGMAMNVGFAIPINLGQQIADQLKRSGRVARGYLGVRSGPFTPELARQFGIPFQPGALVNSVAEKGPAANAGLRANDLIVEIGGRRVDGPDSISQIILARRPGETIKVVVMRGGQRIEAQVILTENADQSSAGAVVLGLRVASLGLRELEELGVKSGLKVLGVQPRGVASGSLQEDDIIIAVDRQAASLITLRDLETRLKQGGAGRLIIQRGQDHLVLTLGY